MIARKDEVIISEDNFKEATSPLYIGTVGKSAIELDENNDKKITANELGNGLLMELIDKMNSKESNV